MEMLPTPGFRTVEERERISSWQLLSAAAGYKSTIAQIFLLSLALEVFAIATPFFLQLVIDRVLVGRDADFLTVLGVAFAALVVIQSMVTALRAWVGVYLSTQINMRMLADLFAQLIRLPLAWFEKRNIGDIISRFRSIDAIQRTLTTTFVEAIIDGVMVVLTLGVMFFYSVTLTSVVLGAALLYGATRWLVYYPQRRATDEQLAHEVEVRHALHRDAARDDGDQAQHARAGAARSATRTSSSSTSTPASACSRSRSCIARPTG